MAAGDLTEDDELDEAIEESFPASDAPANTPETGIRLGAISPRANFIVTDNRDLHRFEIGVEGQIAFLQYERRPDSMVFIHTEVPPALEGRGLASALAKAGLQVARAEHLRIVAQCPFVRAYLRKHPEG